MKKVRKITFLFENVLYAMCGISFMIFVLQSALFETVQPITMITSIVMFVVSGLEMRMKYCVDKKLKYQQRHRIMEKKIELANRASFKKIDIKM